MAEPFRKLDIITIILILVVLVVSSLPLLLIATVFGFISLWVIVQWVSPFIPLLICLGLGWFLWDRIKKTNATLANGILITLVAVGVFLMLYAGYNLFRIGEGSTVYSIYPGGT